MAFPFLGIGMKTWRSSIQSAKTRPGADCGSHHELLIAKFRLKLNNAITEIKSTLEGTNSRIMEGEDRISEVEDRMVEINETEEKRKSY